MVQEKSLILVVIVLMSLIFTGFEGNGLAQQASKDSRDPAVNQPSKTQGPPLSPRKIRLGLEVIADLSVETNKYTGTCPAQISFTGKIYSNKATTINYRFIRSDGTRSLTAALNFEQPGSKEVRDTWRFDSADKLSTTFNGWESIQVTFPAKVDSNKAFFEVICTNREQPASGDSRKLQPNQPGQPAPGVLPGQ
jgi:hypothetical protein